MGQNSLLVREPFPAAKEQLLNKPADKVLQAGGEEASVVLGEVSDTHTIQLSLWRVQQEKEEIGRGSNAFKSQW